MNKISKPPWRVESYLEPFDSVIKTWQVVSAEDLIVAKCGKGDFEIEANAKLISAAPDMMKMLEKMAEALTRIDQWDWAILLKYAECDMELFDDLENVSQVLQEWEATCK